MSDHREYDPDDDNAPMLPPAARRATCIPSQRPPSDPIEKFPRQPRPEER